MTRQRTTRIFWLLSFARWLPIGLLLPVLVLTQLERGLDLAEIGLVFTAYGLTTVLLELPTGGIADSFGRRPVLVVAAILETVMAIVWFTSDSLALFLIAAVVGGVSRALSSGPLEAWYVDTIHGIESDSPIRSGIAGAEAVGGLAVTLGSLAVTAITFIPGIAADGATLSAVRLPALLAAIASGVNALAITAFIVEHRPAAHGLRSAVADVPVVVRRAWDIARGPGAIRWLLGVGVMIGIGFGAVELFYQPLFRELVDSTASATRLFGLLVVGMSLASALGSGVASKIPEDRRIHPGQVGAVSYLLAAASMVALTLTGTVVPGVVAFIAIYAIAGFAHPFTQQILHAGVGASERATMLSGWSLSSQLGLMITGLGLAGIAEVAGIGVTLRLASAALVIAAMFFLVIDRLRVREEMDIDR